MNKLIQITVVIILFSACSVLKKSDKPEKLENSNWVLVNIGNEKPVSENPITLLFQTENKFSGKAACNRYFGEFMQNQNSISFKNVGSTKMACPNLNTESKYFSILNSVESFEIKKSQLHLKSEETTLIFENSGASEIQQ